MKASIRRHGIVIRTVELSGNIAKIGSGEQCEIRIEDPYLAAHVADVIRRAEGWTIADAATSLEGVSRGGTRVEEERIVPGEPYMIGGFELVFEDAGAYAPISHVAPTQQQPMPHTGNVVPRTIVEQPLPPPSGGRPVEVPRTIVDMPLPAETPPSPSSAPTGPQFRPMATAHNVAVPPPASQHPAQPQVAAPGFQTAQPPKKSRRGLLLVAVVGMLLVLVIVVVLATLGGGKGEKQAAKTTTAPVATPTPAPTPPPVDPVAAGDRAAAELQMDKALASWEQAIEKTPNPELQKKYAQAAFEMALVYAAANDTAKSREHFEKVAKYGPAESEEVRMAKARLGQ